jgi:DNA polymerase-3 subunit gamma/tau
MNPYLVIAKRFRPKKFSEVFGQRHVVTTLKNAIALKRVAHAYLFTGCRGSGKTTLARIFAKAINCHNLSPDYEPCNSCPSCLDIMSLRSLDILEIDGASNRGIDDIRQINDSIKYASCHGGFKIIIIDEVHMLTKEAFNALLKTLEEPPEKVKFFFATTEPHKVPATIISRCQRFDLSRISSQEIIQKLQNVANELVIEIDMDALLLIAKISEGSLRDAESLLDQAICFQDGKITRQSIANMMGLLPLEIFEKIDSAYDTSNPRAFFEIAHEIYHRGIDLTYLFEMLLDHYRNLMIELYQIPEDKNILSSEERQLYQKGKKIYTKEIVLRIINYLTKMLSDYQKVPFRKIDIEMAFLFIMKQKTYVSYEEVVLQIEQIEKKFAMPSENETKTTLVLNKEPQKPKFEKPSEKKETIPDITQESASELSLSAPLNKAKPIFPIEQPREDNLKEQVFELPLMNSQPIPVVDFSLSIHKKVQELATGTASARDLNRDLSRFSSPTPIVDRLGGEKFKDQDDGAASCQLLNHFVYNNEPLIKTDKDPQKYKKDTLLQFAAVELRGKLKTIQQ